MNIAARKKAHRVLGQMNISLGYEWPDGWEDVNPEVGTRLAAQLGREVKEEHTLFGVPITTLARRGDNDDVLFLLNGGPAVAVVHLTYHASIPPYPWTTVYSPLEAWAQDADEF